MPQDHDLNPDLDRGGLDEVLSEEGTAESERIFQDGPGVPPVFDESGKLENFISRLQKALAMPPFPSEQTDLENDPILDALSEKMKQQSASAVDTVAFEASDPSVATNPKEVVEASACRSILSPPELADELGRLNGYRILRLLGEGGMGMVFEAEDMHLKRRVALKVMRPEIAAKKQHRDRFIREARSAALVEHDHICPIHQVGQENGVPFIAMPFLKGEPLDVRLKRQRPLPPAEAVRIGREVAEGLAAAHDAGLVHRDIKPANIWLAQKDESGKKKGKNQAKASEPSFQRVRILDFGLARLADDDLHLTQSGTIVGTPAYMAPEQARSRPVDHRADLFSLGVILYEMVTGNRPFSGSDNLSILTSLVIDEPVTPILVNPSVPVELSDFIMQLMSKAPENRPADAHEVSEALTVIATRMAPPIGELGPEPVSTPLASDQTTSVDPWQAGDEAANPCGTSETASRELSPATGATPATGPTTARRGAKRVLLPYLLGLAVAVAAAVVSIIGHKDGREVADIEKGAIEIKDRAIASKTITPAQSGFEAKVVDPSPVPSGPAANEEKPFLLRRSGKPVGQFATFSAVLADHRNGDVIEIHSSGLLEMPRIHFNNVALTIKAAPGYRPRLAPVPSEPFDWIHVESAPTRLEGCDLLAHSAPNPLRAIWASGPCEIVNCRIRTGDSNSGEIVMLTGPRNRIADSMLIGGFSHRAVVLGPKAELDFENNIFWNAAGEFFTLAEPGGQAVRFKDNTFQGGGNLVRLLGKRSEVARVEAERNLFAAPQDALCRTDSLDRARVKDFLQWRGRSNLYCRSHPDSMFLHASAVETSIPTLDEWIEFWGKNEDGAAELKGQYRQFEAAWAATDPATAVEAVRQAIESARGARPIEAGPSDWALIGPGEAYVRSQQNCGKLPNEATRPEPVNGGPMTLVRNGKALQGYPNLAAALDAAADGDVVEARTDKVFEAFNRQGKKGKSILLRSAPGYRPVAGGQLVLARDDVWSIEGLHFLSAVNALQNLTELGQITRLANCSFAFQDSTRGSLCLTRRGKGAQSPIEVVNCMIPEMLAVCLLPPGQKVIVRNSVLGSIQAWETGRSKDERSLELDRCVFWLPAMLQPAFSSNLNDASIRIRATRCWFESHFMWLANRSESVNWSGDRNVFRLAKQEWFWPPLGKGQSIPRRLDAWQRVFHSDAQSVAGDPLFFDPLQWKLLPGTPGHGKGPNGKDLGADVSKVAVTAGLRAADAGRGRMPPVDP